MNLGLGGYGLRNQMHKVFISYYHHRDQAYREVSEKYFDHLFNLVSPLSWVILNQMRAPDTSRGNLA